MTTRVQGGRTATPASPPANNSLQPGELYVEMASPLRLWTGVPTSVTASGVKLILDATAQAAANSSAVQKAGDVMTGPLTLSGSPTQPAQAASKAYADTKVATVAGHPGPDVVLTHTDISDWTASLAPYALLASPPLTGNPTAPTPAPGDNDTSIATTAFVAAAISAQPGTVIAPTIPAFKAGQLWWDATGGSLYVGYDDGNTQAYVPATNITLPANVATKADVGQALNNVGRNLVHNPLMNVAQRGAGSWATSGAYTVDRWLMWANTDTLNISQQPVNDGQRAAIGDEAARFCVALAVTSAGAAGSQSLFEQRIEDVRRLGGKTVIVSFWAVGNAALKLGVTLGQNFGAGGSPSAAVTVQGQAANVTTSWVRYSLTFNMPSTSGKTLGTTPNTDFTSIDFWLSSGATNSAISGGVPVQNGASFSLWGVQLEIAQPGQTVPTPLEKRDPVLELQQAQRFYQAGFFYSAGQGTLGTGVGCSTMLPVPLRATPTTVVITSTAGSANLSGFSLNAAGNIAARMDASPIATGGYYLVANFTASADL